MAEPVLDGPGVAASIGQGVAAAVTQHVGVDARWPGALADALDEPVDGIGRERSAALGGEDERRVWALPPQIAQRADLVAAERMRGRLP
jgi:hypothetical protein